jgi:tetratricopeptide (TPR) repeat protein
MAWPRIALGCGLFAFALALRLHFFCGFILADDGQEFPMMKTILASGPIWSDQLHARFGGWILNLLSLKLFGVSEASLFLPTIVLSASFAVLGYVFLLGSGYGVVEAGLAGAFVASAPFEVLTGALRANDLYLAWSVALGCFVLLRCEGRPVLQGLLLAVCFWFGFYVKLWTVYFLPPLAVYYLYRRSWLGAASFAASSIVLHGATLLFWKTKTGRFFPFLSEHAASYPISTTDLPHLFTDYPKLLFVGSDLGTTLFGAVPYLLVVLLCLKIVARWLPARGGRDFARWDRLDVLLVAAYGAFLALLNFFPNSFSFDRYYSVPRIFRYLSPLSFPLTLHVAKMLIDLAAAVVRRPQPLLVPVFLALIAVNVVQAGQATEPGRGYRRALLAVRDDIRRAAPPVVITESSFAAWLQQLYLNDPQDRTTVMTAYQTHSARQYEAWLAKEQPRLPAGAMLVSGLGGCVFYGAPNEGFRLRLFERPLPSDWTLVSEYEPLPHFVPDTPQLWRLSRASVQAAAEAPQEPPLPVEGDTAQALFTNGMRHFDAYEYPQARADFKAVIERFPAAAEDARYFYAVSLFREQRWEESIAAFDALIRATPEGRWIAAAYYHLGRSKLALRRVEEARQDFRHVVEHFPNDANTCALAEEALAGLPDNRGLLGRLLDSVRARLSR